MPLNQRELRQLASALFHASKTTDHAGNPQLALQTALQLLSPYCEDGGWVELNVDKAKSWMTYKVHFADAPEGKPNPNPPF